VAGREGTVRAVASIAMADAMADAAPIGAAARLAAVARAAVVPAQARVVPGVHGAARAVAVRRVPRATVAAGSAPMAEGAASEVGSSAPIARVGAATASVPTVLDGGIARAPLAATEKAVAEAVARGTPVVPHERPQAGTAVILTPGVARPEVLQGRNVGAQSAGIRTRTVSRGGNVPSVTNPLCPTMCNRRISTGRLGSS
jgi:hypothetical protein